MLVSPKDQVLWNRAYALRGFVESKFTFSQQTNPLSEREYQTLIAAVEQIYRTEQAMLTFLCGDHSDDLGEQELRKLGLVQALSVQQDAVSELSKIIVGKKFNPHSDPRLREIRKEIRIPYAGHPVSDRGGPLLATAYAPADEAAYIDMAADGPGIRRYCLRTVVEDQMRILLAAIIDIEAQVYDRERSMREDLARKDPLSILRDTSFEYELSNAHPDCPKMPELAAKELERCIVLYRKAFAEFGEKNGTAPETVRMKHAALRVRAFYEDAPNPGITALDVPVFLNSLQADYDQLKSYAEEIRNELHREL